MISLLVSLVVFLVVAGLIYWLILQLPIPEPFLMMIKVAAVIICILVLLGFLYGGVPLPHLR